MSRLSPPSSPHRALIAFLILVLAGCAGPERRIARDPELFASLTPTEQALIRDGTIAVGFTPAMVRMAIGEPNQRWRRTDASGQAEVWSYTSRAGYDGAPLDHGRPHRIDEDRPYFADQVRAAGSRPRELLRVTFRDGRVVEIERQGP